MLCYVMLCYVMLCYVMLCYVMLCYVVLCCVVLCCVVLCCVVLCCVVLCCVVLLPTSVPTKLSSHFLKFFSPILKIFFFFILISPIILGKCTNYLKEYTNYNNKTLNYTFHNPVVGSMLLK